MSFTKNVRFHLIGGGLIDADCSKIGCDTLETFFDNFIYYMLDEKYIRVSNLVIPSKSVLFIECLDDVAETVYVTCANGESEDIIINNQE